MASICRAVSEEKIVANGGRTDDERQRMAILKTHLVSITVQVSEHHGSDELITST